MENKDNKKDFKAYCDERGFFTIKECYDEEVKKEKENILLFREIGTSKSCG